MIPNIKINYQYENFEPYPGLRKICERRVSILEHHVFKKPEGWILDIKFRKKNTQTVIDFCLHSQHKTIAVSAEDIDDSFAVYKGFNLLKKKFFNHNNSRPVVRSSEQSPQPTV